MMILMIDPRHVQPNFLLTLLSIFAPMDVNAKTKLHALYFLKILKYFFLHHNPIKYPKKKGFTIVGENLHFSPDSTK